MEELTEEATKVRDDIIAMRDKPPEQVVADLLPTLNISADPRVDNLRDELIDNLTMVPPEILKNSMAQRESVVSKADALLAKVAGFMA